MFAMPTLSTSEKIMAAFAVILFAYAMFLVQHHPDAIMVCDGQTVAGVPTPNGFVDLNGRFYSDCQ